MHLKDPPHSQAHTPWEPYGQQAHSPVMQNAPAKQQSPAPGTPIGSKRSGNAGAWHRGGPHNNNTLTYNRIDSSRAAAERREAKRQTSPTWSCARLSVVSLALGRPTLQKYTAFTPRHASPRSLCRNRASFPLIQRLEMAATIS